MKKLNYKLEEQIVVEWLVYTRPYVQVTNVIGV